MAKKIELMGYCWQSKYSFRVTYGQENSARFMAKKMRVSGLLLENHF